MPRPYKAPNGRITARAGNGRFKRTYLSDIMEGVNAKGQVFICNVCNEEFVPVMLEGKCCGVNDKRPKPEPIPTPEEQVILDNISAIKNKPFIGRLDIRDIEQLERDLRQLKIKNKGNKDV